MYLADAFIQSDLHCIQGTVSTFYQLLLSLGIEPMILALLTPCSTSWATGKLLPSRQRLFQGWPCVFQQNKAKPHTAAIYITTAWLCVRRVRVLNWPACSSDLSTIENIWHIIKRKIYQRWHKLVSSWKTYIRQEWDQIPTPKLQKIMSRHLQTVLRRKGESTPW